MHTYTTAELKAHFSDVISEVREGETVIVTYGRRKEKVAAIVPYEQLNVRAPRPLGVLEESAGYRAVDDFEMSDEELLEA